MKQGPENIKWENKLRYKRHFKLRSIIVVIISLLLYYFLFQRIYLLKNKIESVKQIKPTDDHCNSLEGSYAQNKQLMYDQAKVEFAIIQKNLEIVADNVKNQWFSEIPKNRFKITRGVFVCSCNITLKSILDVVKDDLELVDQEFPKDMPEELINGCIDYKTLLKGTIDTKFYLGIFISLITSITRYFIIFSIKWIGIPSLSKEIKRIK